MGSILDYIREYGTYTFKERPFSAEDGLVLAQFSYLRLDGLVPAPGDIGAAVTIGELARLGNLPYMFGDTCFAAENAALFKALKESVRFQTMRINYYVNRIATGEASQFSAVTCFPEDAPVYLAFRGTDETLAGWQEDFSMIYKLPVKGQELAAQYADKVAACTEGSLFFGGHSKGGNLAVYAAAVANPRIQDRIRCIYNLDGPGFQRAFTEREEYQRIRERICKIVPRSSVIGMILEKSGEYEVVESRGIGIMQHDPFTWILRDGHFLTTGEVTKRRRAAALVINRFLQQLSPEDARRFVEELFLIASRAGAETVLDFSGSWRELFKRAVELLKDADEETKRSLHRAGRTLFLAFWEEAERQMNTIGKNGKKRRG